MSHESLGSETLFFDTYALYQIALGAKEYEQLAKKRVVTTLMNAYELYYTLLREGYADLGESFLKKLSTCCVEYTLLDIRLASEFRLLHKKKGFSYVDALGYIVARRNNLLFLTGDKEFEGLEGVYFVK